MRTLEKCAKQHKKTQFPSRAQFKLLVAHFYSTTCRRHGNLPSAQEIANSRSYMELSGMYMSAKDSKESGNTSNKPPKFEAGTSFVKWQKLAEAYLWSITNPSGIPLAYVIRTDDNPPATQESYPSLKAKLVACTEHDGEGYSADNEHVWTIMQEAIMNGPGWAYIRSFARGKDGRKAWKSLSKHYLGSGPISTEKQKAYAAIKAAKYTGESARFTFETYVSTLQNAYETLAEFDEPVAEAKKVQDFLDGIQVTNTYVSAAVANVTTNNDMKENFTAASDYVATTVQNHKGTLSKRRISKLERKKRQEKKKKPKLEAKNYSRAEWDKFSQEDKDKITAMRKAAKEAKKRKAAALEAGKEEEEADESAGDAMARKKGKKGE